MPLQDLTPQLRTRLSRMERAVGWFVVVAVLLLAFGLGYYVYNNARSKGWFVIKAPYFTFLQSATGLKVGDPVKLMGFDVGQITEITGMPPFSGYDVYVGFEVKAPYFDYLWTEGSVAKVAASGLLAGREVEVTKGINGFPTFTQRPLRDVSIAEAQLLPDWTNWGLAQVIRAPQSTNLLGKPWQPLTNLATIAAAGYSQIRIMNKVEKRKTLSGVWDDKTLRYEFYSRSNRYWLHSVETPVVTEQAQALVAQVQQALPGIFNLTNQLTAVLTNTTSLTSNLNIIALSARPAVSNLAAATAHLDQPGALGEWLLPTNLNRQLEGTLGTANSTLATANTNLTALVSNLNRSLDNLADITSNLNTQVAANTNLVRSVSDTITHADEFVQGLKRFWLFRHLFKSKATNAPPPVPPRPLLSPKAESER